MFTKVAVSRIKLVVKKRLGKGLRLVFYCGASVGKTLSSWIKARRRHAGEARIFIWLKYVLCEDRMRFVATKDTQSASGNCRVNTETDTLRVRSARACSLYICC